MSLSLNFKAGSFLIVLLLGLSTASAEDFIQAIGGFNLLLYGVAAGIAALMIVFHAIRWKTASGPADRDAAKKGITNVILGLALIIIAASVVNLLYQKPNVLLVAGASCNQLDGWYTIKGLGPTCSGNGVCTDTVEKSERSYTLSGGGCVYAEKSIKIECAVAVKPCPAGQTCQNGVCSGGAAPSCDMLDGWYTSKSLGPTCVGGKQCLDTVEKVYRDYYLSAGSCQYAETQRKTECASTLKDCPQGAKCDNGFCIAPTATTQGSGVTTVQQSTSTTTTSTTTTSTTIPPEKLLTAKNLVDCINSKNGKLQSIEPVSGCAHCRLIKCKVFGKETDPPVGPGLQEYYRLDIIKEDMGPIWIRADGKKTSGCMMMPQISDFFGCGLVPVPGHAYKKCEEDPGVINFDC